MSQVLHRCPLCGKWFDWPSICQDGSKTVLVTFPPEDVALMDKLQREPTRTVESLIDQLVEIRGLPEVGQ